MGDGETTNQKGVLGVGKNPEEPKCDWKFEETKIQNVSSGWVKPQKNRKTSGGWGNDQTEGGPRGG